VEAAAVAVMGLAWRPVVMSVAVVPLLVQVKEEEATLTII